jgi:hypothetical protein
LIPVKDILKNKPFPKWFSGHRIFKEIEKIDKVFPGIGLSNCTEDVEVDNKKSAAKAAEDLIDTISKKVSKRIDALNKFEKEHPDMSASRKEKLAKCVGLLSSINDFAKKDKSKFILDNNGRVSIGMPEDISYKDEPRPTYRKDESMFRVYNKLNLSLRDGLFVPLKRLEDTNSFKNFSKENIPNNTYKVVFSSDNDDGAWDIATMSMRGIESCQTWGGDYSHCTIGSVIDPFVGIVYLTSGVKLKHGTKMMKRCIVRFVIEEKTKKPIIILDYMYPQHDAKVLEAFIKLIKEKVNNKFEVHYAANMGYDKINKVYLPYTDIRKKLAGYDKHGGKSVDGGVYSIASYQDVKIKNKASNDVYYLYDKNSNKKSDKFISSFTEAFIASFKTIPISDFPGSAKSIVKSLKGDKKLINANIIANIGKNIATKIVASVDKSNFNNSNTYTKRIYYNYFNTRYNICDEIKGQVAKQINSQLSVLKRIKADRFIQMMEVVLPQVDIVMKKELKELVGKRKASNALPLPE